MLNRKRGGDKKVATLRKERINKLKLILKMKGGE